MFNLGRNSSLCYVMRNFGVTKKLFESTSVLPEKQDTLKTQKDSLDSSKQKVTKKTKSPIVSAAFALLENTEENSSNVLTSKQNYDSVIDETVMGLLKKSSNKLNSKNTRNSEIDETIKTVDSLLGISEEKPEQSRKPASKIVFNFEKVNTDNNKRNEAKLYQIIEKTPNLKVEKNLSKQTMHLARNQSDDIKLILGVAGDDEAAKLIGTITLPQMVKVLKSLSLRKRRSTPVLRSLSFNMSDKKHKMDLAMCTDVLYSLATLNFPEPVLLAKISEHIQEALNEPVKRSFLVGSCIKSLALMKYRDPLLLDSFTEWIYNNEELCRAQDTSSVIRSLALLNYLPSEHEDFLRNKIFSSLTPLDLKNSADYLGLVWSLMLLDHSNQETYNTVLSQEFIDKLVSASPDKQLTPTVKMKLLNINAAVKLFFPTYSGAMLHREQHKDIYDVPLAHNKEKQLIVNGMIDAIKSVVPEKCLKLNYDTGMGFVIDADFYLDDKGNPVAEEKNGGKRVALIVNDFHDHCQGPHQTLNGIAAFNIRLLSKAGYHAISVPYNEFSISDKLLKRIQYLEDIIKRVTKTK